MTYPRDLEEYHDTELKAELKRREKLTKKRLCTYCEASVDAPACRFPERHSKKSRTKTPSIDFGDVRYELTQAFCEGALAYHGSVPWTENPYNDEDDRHWQWCDGHELASGDAGEDREFTKKQAEKALKEAKKRRL